MTIILGISDDSIPEPGTYALPDHCPACGERIDHCLGHGMVGDPHAYLVLTQHDSGDHSDCHPLGCSG